MSTHADIAAELVAKLPPGVFAHGARDAVLHQDFITLQRMLPGVLFSTLPVGPNLWQLTGVCEDGSVVMWEVGGY